MPRSIACTAVAAALATLAVAAPAAGAHTTQLKGGTTELSLSRQAENALVDLGVVTGRLSFRITSGAIALGSGGGVGTIDHAGALVLRSRGASVSLGQLRIDNGERSGKLSGVMGGRRLVLATIGYRGAVADHDDADVHGLRLRLTGAAARALNTAFRTSRFAPGLALGTLDVDGIERNVVQTFTTGTTTIVLDPGLVAKLAAKNVSLTALAPSTGNGTTAAPFSFALTEGKGQVTEPDAFSHSGGLVLAVPGAASLTLSELEVEIGHHGAHVTASSPFGPLALFELDLSKVESAGKHGEVDLSQIGLLPGANLAAVLAPVLGLTPAATAKLVVGTATLTAKA